MSTSISLEEEDYLELPSGLSHEEASRRIHHNYLLYKSQLDRFKVEAKPNIEYASSKSNAKPLWKIILRDMSGDGEWRVSEFDSGGFVGHMCYNTFAEAAEQVFRDFGGNQIEDPGALRRVSATREWKDRMEIEMQRQNQDSERLTSTMLNRIANDISTVYFNTDDPETLPEIVQWIEKGWEVYTAPRPIYGTESIRGGGGHGWFYAAIDPADDYAERSRIDILRLGSNIVQLVSNDEILKRVEAYYREQYPEEAEEIWADVIQNLEEGDTQMLRSAAGFLGFPWYQERKHAY